MKTKTNTEKLKAIDSNIESCFKILEQEINKKSELCDPKKLDHLARMSEYIIEAVQAFNKTK